MGPEPFQTRRRHAPNQGDPADLLPAQGDTVLYLGAGHGTSVSHLYDHLCGSENRYGGRLVCVDLAPRCLRDLTFMAANRPGLVPVLGDARKHAAWGVLLPPRFRGCFRMWLKQARSTFSSRLASVSFRPVGRAAVSQSRQ